MEKPNQQLSIDNVFIALSNQRRRELLDSLIADSPPDDAVGSGIVVDDDVTMHHCHLPKLADYGLIDWDRTTNYVTKGTNFEAAKPILECVANPDGILSTGEMGK